jgi:hypothetical protein
MIEPLAIHATLDRETIKSDGIDFTTLSGYPTPCQISVISDDLHLMSLCRTHGFTITAKTPGNYVVNITAPGYSDFSTQFEAVANVD